MSIKIALAGNPNSGKTTLFNALTGSNQYVGNWPGVTVEKKEGRLKGRREVVLQDLPGVYSLSPYTPEEVITRNYLLTEQPDAILNLVDATNLERNLYLTTQLAEIGLPLVVALNMIDVVHKNGDKVDAARLSQMLGCPVVAISALKGEGCQQAVEEAIRLAEQKIKQTPPAVFGGAVEHAIAHIEDIIHDLSRPEHQRWYAIKLFERDAQAAGQLELTEALSQKIEAYIAECEQALDDDAESIISNERYDYIGRLAGAALSKRHRPGHLSSSDKIDRVVTNRFLALPIFMAVMFAVYYISVTTVGDIVTVFTKDTLFGAWIQEPLAAWMANIGAAAWLNSLIVDGVIGGVGAVLGFVPQMFILFLFLAILEDIGYMARVAFIMDRIFRKFGLSGKSFIPMLIGSGCSVPGIMASRTIENERDRRMTVITTSFIPCGAKMPIVGLVAGALFGGAWWVAPSAYFIGVTAVVFSGIILKKTRLFAGKPAPFVMELPAYHVPAPRNVLASMWERGWSFIRRAGSIILVASIVVWTLSSLTLSSGAFAMADDIDTSILAAIGNSVAVIFAPLGFGNWQSTVATVLGLVAKEEVVAVFGVLYGVAGDALGLVEAGSFSSLAAIAAHFTPLSAFSFLIFNLLCAPCFAAIGAIRREMDSGRWTVFAVAYQCLFAYMIALIVYQAGLLALGGAFTAASAAAALLLLILLYLLFRPGWKEKLPAAAAQGQGPA